MIKGAAIFAGGTCFGILIGAVLTTSLAVQKAMASALADQYEQKLEKEQAV